MKSKIFIDGSAGTTGLRIYDRLSSRKDLDLIILDEDRRKDPAARKEALNSCDLAFLCLPDEASKEAVANLENDKVKIIDTSTAHRTAPGWAYGFPELGEDFYNKIESNNLIASPGCHASGFIALVKPLIDKGIISPKLNLTCHSITGYSGGGKKMIAEYEDDELPLGYGSPRQYGLSQQHKHLKEMKAISGIAENPIFCPIVSDFYSGMVVTVPLFMKDTSVKELCAIKDIYKEKYTGPVVKYVDSIGENGYICSDKLSYYDNMEIFVEGNDDRILLIARYDNLGKGASGAAVQCMNIALGKEMTLGLQL